MKKNLFFIFLTIFVLILLLVILYNLQIQENFGIFDSIGGSIVGGLKTGIVDPVNTNIVKPVESGIDTVNNIQNIAADAAEKEIVKEASKYVTNPSQYLSNRSIKDIIKNPPNINDPSIQSQLSSFTSYESDPSVQSAVNSVIGKYSNTSLQSGFEAASEIIGSNNMKVVNSVLESTIGKDILQSGMQLISKYIDQSTFEDINNIISQNNLQSGIQSIIQSIGQHNFEVAVQSICKIVNTNDIQKYIKYSIIELLQNNIKTMLQTISKYINDKNIVTEFINDYISKFNMETAIQAANKIVGKNKINSAISTVTDIIGKDNITTAIEVFNDSIIKNTINKIPSKTIIKSAIKDAKNSINNDEYASAYKTFTSKIGKNNMKRIYDVTTKAILDTNDNSKTIMNIGYQVFGHNKVNTIIKTIKKAIGENNYKSAINELIKEIDLYNIESKIESVISFISKESINTLIKDLVDNIGEDKINTSLDSIIQTIIKNNYSQIIEVVNLYLVKLCGSRFAGSGTGSGTGSGAGNQQDSPSNINHKVIRKDFTINGETYTGTHKTPCFNKTDDFNEWCRNYMDKDNISIASGNNTSNTGAKNIIIGNLNGKDGDCGNPNLAQAICDFNYFDQINKINPEKKCDTIYNNNGSNNCKEVNYNMFTDCLHPDSTLQDYKDQCDRISGTSSGIYSPVEFSGYDCNPGYFRAKCVNKNDNLNLMNSNLDNMYGILGGNNLPPQEECNNCLINKCNCSQTPKTTPSSA